MARGFCGIPKLHVGPRGEAIGRREINISRVCYWIIRHRGQELGRFHSIRLNNKAPVGFHRSNIECAEANSCGTPISTLGRCCCYLGGGLDALLSSTTTSSSSPFSFDQRLSFLFILPLFPTMPGLLRLLRKQG